MTVTPGCAVAIKTSFLSITKLMINDITETCYERL